MSVEARSDHAATSDTADGSTTLPDGRSLRLIVVVMAFACGAAVANLYYAQPLLDLIARDFHVGEGTASIAVTATQIGYAIGLALLLPLGDLYENRTLTSRILVLTALSLLGAAFAPGLGVFLAASVVIGLASVVAQILVPLAAHLAPPETRGHLVGQVMSGLLLGILLARTLASLAAAAWGWRSIYVISAGLMIVTAGLLLRVLPRRTPPHTTGYRSLLASLGELVRDEPVLRRRALRQGLMFAAFSAYWTAVAYVLVDRHGLSQIGIAIFALVGAAGAAAAPVAGRLGDRGHGRIASVAAMVLGVIAMIVSGVGAGNLVLLGLGAVLLDLAVQGHQVLGQREIYALREDARARINTVYMTTIFVCGAAGSAITGALHDAGGWSAVCAFGAALPVLALLVWAWGEWRDHRAVV